MELIDAVLPTPSAAAVDASFEEVLEACAARGLTGVHDLAALPGDLDYYASKDAAGALTLRLHVFRDAAEHGSPPPLPWANESALVRCRGAKFFADGAMGSWSVPGPRGSSAAVGRRGLGGSVGRRGLGSSVARPLARPVGRASRRTPRPRNVVREGTAQGRRPRPQAAMLEPYSDRNTTGTLVYNLTALTEGVETWAAAGYQVASHAIGDAANRQVLDAYEAAGVTPGNRWRVEHAQIIAPSDLPRFAALGVLPSMQPSHVASD